MVQAIVVASSKSKSKKSKKQNSSVFENLLNLLNREFYISVRYSGAPQLTQKRAPGMILEPQLAQNFAGGVGSTCAIRCDYKNTILVFQRLPRVNVFEGIGGIAFGGALFVAKEYKNINVNQRIK